MNDMKITLGFAALLMAGCTSMPQGPHDPKALQAAIDSMTQRPAYQYTIVQPRPQTTCRSVVVFGAIQTTCN